MRLSVFKTFVGKRIKVAVGVWFELRTDDFGHSVSRNYLRHEKIYDPRMKLLYEWDWNMLCNMYFKHEETCTSEK